MPVMPDTRIPLSGDDGGRGQSSSPFQTLGAMMQIKEQQQAYQMRQREAQLKQRELDDDNDTRQALMQYQQPEEAIDHLMRAGNPDAARKLARNVYDERTARLQADDTQLKSNLNRLTAATQLLGSATDDTSYQTVRPQVLEMVKPIYGDKVDDALPTQWDEGKVKQLITAGTSRAEQIQQAQNLSTSLQHAYDLGLLPASELAKRDPTYTKGADVSEWSPNGLRAQEAHQETLAQVLVNAKDKQSWDTFKNMARDRGTPPIVLERFGEWDENAPERARNLGMSIKERAAAEAQANRSETAAEREERLRRQGANAPPRGELSKTARFNEQDSLEKEIAETEKWAEKRLVDTPPPDNAPANASGYDLLSDKDKQEYVRRRVASENKNRDRLQGGLPPIDVAARAAVRKGDSAGYAKLATVYSKITQGLGKLEDLVPPPMTPANQKELDTIVAQLKDPKLPADKRLALQRRRNQLMPALR